MLHVLPHPGGGGETYVDALERMGGYRFDRAYLAPSPTPDTLRARLDVLRRGLEIVRVARRFDVLHVHGEVAAGICAPALAVAGSVVTTHGLHLLRRTTGTGHLLARANLRLVVRAATRTICVGRAEYDEVREAVGGRAAPRLRLILNGVEVPPRTSPSDRAAARDELDLPPAAVVGAYVGSLEEHKDPATAALGCLALARRGAPIALLLAGDGPLRPDLERLRLEPGGESLRLLGHLPDVGPVLAAADFFVLPSLREGLSFALLSGMALGLPAVVSDAPDNVEAVGDAGLVVRRRDVAGFAAAFGRLLSDEPARVALGDRARARVERRFGADRMVSVTQLVYDEVTARRRVR